MKRIVIVVLFSSMFFLTGCSSTFYHGRYPVLEKPDRPALVNVSGDEMKKMSSDAQAAVTGNFDKLVKHVTKLEAAIDTYNVYATEQNKTLGTGEKQ